MRTRVERRATGDDGVGLPEMLVAMAMFGIVVIAVGSVFVGLLDSSRTAAARTATTADARIAMEAMTRSMRVAIVPAGEPAAFTETSANGVQFYASLDRGAGQTADRPTRVTYSYDASSGCVNETQVIAVDSTAADAASRPFTWPGAGTTKCLLRSSSPPSFTYFGVGTIHRTDGSLVPPVLPTTDAERTTVVSVEASLTVQDPERTDVNGVVARDRVALVNLLSSANGKG